MSEAPIEIQLSADDDPVQSGLAVIAEKNALLAATQIYERWRNEHLRGITPSAHATVEAASGALIEAIAKVITIA